MSIIAWCRLAKDELIGPTETGEVVVAGAAFDRIISIAADDGVIAVVSEQAVGRVIRQLLVGDRPDEVVTLTTKDRVGGNVAASQRVIPGVPKHDIARRVVPDDGVIAVTAEDCIPSGHAANGVVAATAENQVIASACIDIVVSLAALDNVVAVAAFKPVVPGKATDDVIAAEPGKKIVALRSDDNVVVVICDCDQLTPDLARRKLRPYGR